MANKKHVEIVKQGTELILVARSKSPEIQFDLKGATLYQTDLSGADLSYCVLRRANINKANLINANLAIADLSFATLVNVDLSGANLKGANLTGCDMKGCNLSGADLSGADLTEANLEGATLAEANLSGATLKWTYLRGADLWESNLQNALLIENNLRNADLTGAKLEGARLRGVILANATGYNLSEKQIDVNYKGDKKPWLGRGNRILLYSLFTFLVLLGIGALMYPEKVDKQSHNDMYSNTFIGLAFGALGIGFLVGSAYTALDKGYPGELGFIICFLFFALGAILSLTILPELFAVAPFGLVIVTCLGDQSRKNPFDTT